MSRKSAHNLSSEVSPHDIAKTRASLSKSLLIFAWVVEVIAVTIGLGISLGMATEAAYALGESKELLFPDYLNIGIAALPFFLVAVVELTKIPMAGAFYYTESGRYRLLFGLTLIFLAFITFETAFNGFERNFANLRFVIEEQLQELLVRDERISELERQRGRLQEMSAEQIEARYNQRQEALIAEREKNLSVQRERMRDVRAKAQSEYIDSLETERADLIASRNQYRSEQSQAADRAATAHQADLDARRQAQASQRERIAGSIERIEAQLSELRSELVATTGLFSGPQRDRINTQIAELQTQRAGLQRDLSQIGVVTSDVEQAIRRATAPYEDSISAISTQVEEINQRIAEALNQQERGLQQELDPIEDEIARITAVFVEQQAANTADRERAFEELARREEQLTDVVAQFDILAEERLKLRQSINEEARGNQVFRITQSWTGKEAAADLKPDEIAITATVWFGSLSAVVALTGILLALASYVVRDDPELFRKRAGQASRLLASLRRLVMFARVRTRTRTVKVAVPGEKERLIVHTPVFVDREHFAVEQTKAEPAVGESSVAGAPANQASAEQSKG